MRSPVKGGLLTTAHLGIFRLGRLSKARHSSCLEDRKRLDADRQPKSISRCLDIPDLQPLGCVELRTLTLAANLGTSFGIVLS